MSKMGLKEILRIRQYTSFDAMGRVVKMYEITFTTEKTETEFTLDLKAVDYTPELAKEQAAARAEAIDQAIS